jgi:hypothetical protein
MRRGMFARKDAYHNSKKSGYLWHVGMISHDMLFFNGLNRPPPLDPA